MHEKTYLLWLSNVKGLGIITIQRLLTHFKTAKAIYDAPHQLLLDKGVSNHVISAIREAKQISPDFYETILAEQGVSYVTLACDAYPERLKHIPSPPAVLYIKGTLPDDDIPIVAMVGSRKASEYGVRLTLEISKYLASRGVVIASGMARGIDGFAHRGALDVGGTTLAVLGCGVDMCYPTENKAIYEAIPHQGALISEYFPGTPAHAGHFPMRNRIISGLSMGVVVTEASPNSGSLITVERALDQCRDVFAVPGNVTSKLSYGTNDLIKQGAFLITSGQDVIEILRIKTLPPENTEINNPTRGVSATLTGDEKHVYDLISSDAISVDTLLQHLHATSIDAQKLQYVLTMLELKQHIQRLPGSRYARVTHA